MILIIFLSILQASSFYALLRVITFYGGGGGGRFDNFWEINWLGARHLITCYCPFRRKDSAVSNLHRKYALRLIL